LKPIAYDRFIFKREYVVVKAMRGEEWAEAIGLSLYMSAVTDRKPGVLLVTRPNDKHMLQAKLACIRGDIKLWTVTVD